MSGSTTVGEVIVAFLERCGVKAVFGVISIHNMPILDAIGRRGEIRYVCARSEGGAVNMSDGYARVGRTLGVAISSTGTAAGNACGALVEANSAGTPLLHITGQVETPYLDTFSGYIHEAPNQLSMLKAVSKRAYRVTSHHSALDIIKIAVQDALTSPTGPVSVEVPIDIQQKQIDWPFDLSPIKIKEIAPDPGAVRELAEKLSQAKRPLLWLGGGARHAQDVVQRLASMGFGIVTSVNGRGIIPEDHEATLGAYNLYPPVEDFYKSCDAMLVAGSRLRSNETLKYKLCLPSPFYQIDVDERALYRPYKPEMLVLGDSRLVLESMADRLEGKLITDKEFKRDLQTARSQAAKLLRDSIKPYNPLVDAIQEAVKEGFAWVRDVTVSNSTWGNRAVLLGAPTDGVHALGGGIGQAIQMAIGAAIADPEKKVICLVGDGGLQVNVGEMATAVQEKVNLTVLLMNSKDYEVIKNIQDASFGGRHFFSDIYTPDFKCLADSMGWSYKKLTSLDNCDKSIRAAVAENRVSLLEIDMTQIGPYARPFGGPPTRSS